jgi:hypothetical protein
VSDLLSISITQSSSPSSAATGFPTRADSGSTQMPWCSSPRPSSRSEQIMPWLSTPRIFETLIFKSPGSSTPGSATATFCPAATFDAPHTIFRSVPSPTSTVHSPSLSASGCFSRDCTWPTTTLSMCGRKRSRPSTSAVWIVRSCAICCGVMPVRSTCRASQRVEIFI